jgi:hypothetical protein
VVKNEWSSTSTPQGTFMYGAFFTSVSVIILVGDVSADV